MSLNDPIADFLTRVRNGLQADHDAVVMPHSHFKTEIARILSEQGYVEGYAVEPGRVGQELRVTLKYTENRGAGEIPKVQGGMGTTIVSTSRGVMTGHEARKARVGGELVAKVW